jgi:predicted AlkP superfamily phosphohydrolase/phosphomutase
MVDVKGFRTEDKDWLLAQIYQMTTKRFTVAKHLLKTRPWDFFMMVEMGTDRIHHGFWQFMDEQRVRYPGANSLEEAIHDYYVYLDSMVGELLEFADDYTRVMIVSDHGAKRMEGAICVNEWLVQKGYLVLKRYPAEPTRLENLEVDWSHTRAWGEGGYYGRVFLNVAGREPQGMVPATEYDRTRRQLKQELEDLCGPQGNRLRTTAVLSDEAYRETRNIAPDLSVFFDDLYWRASGTVGGGNIYTRHNDTGPDGANHDWYGIFGMAEGKDLKCGRGGSLVEGLSLLDVAPTILQAYGIVPLPGMRGIAITPERLPVARQCVS